MTFIIIRCESRQSDRNRSRFHRVHLWRISETYFHIFARVKFSIARLFFLFSSATLNRLFWRPFVHSDSANCALSFAFTQLCERELFSERFSFFAIVWKFKLFFFLKIKTMENRVRKSLFPKT